MINHHDCDHPSTSGARAKCRRARSNGIPSAPSTPRQKKTDEEEDRYGQTPRDRHLECDKCGVEKILYKGTDMITGIVIYVGDRCRWYIKNAPDLEVLP